MTPINNNDFTDKTASFPTIVLKGLGQIMLQEKPVTGFLFLLGIFFASFIMGTASLSATVCSTATVGFKGYGQVELCQL